MTIFTEEWNLCFDHFDKTTAYAITKNPVKTV